MSKLVPLGMEMLVKYLNLKDYVDRVFTACGVETQGLIKSEAEMAQEEQAQQQAQQQAMMAQALPQAVAAGGKLMQQGMEQQ